MFMLMVMVMVVVMVVVMVMIMVMIMLISAEFWTGYKSSNRLFVSFWVRFNVTTILILLVGVGYKSEFLTMFFFLTLFLAGLSTICSLAVVHGVGQNVNIKSVAFIRDTN